MLINIMTIMRSERIEVKFMEILKKVKKPTINWYKVMKVNINVDVSRAFIKLIQSNPDRSFNFNAYQALRHYYSHDRLEYWRWCVYGRFE